MRKLRADGSFIELGKNLSFNSRIQQAAVVDIYSRTKLTSLSSSNDRPRDDIDNDLLDDSSDLPLQVLLLTLDSARIVFAYVLSSNSSAANRFLSTYEQPLFKGKSFATTLGTHLAVDPKSRAFAVGASSSSFAIYSVFSAQELAHTHRSTDNLNIVKEVSFKSMRFYTCANVCR
jgi:hypothetical protein